MLGAVATVVHGMIREAKADKLPERHSTGVRVSA